MQIIAAVESSSSMHTCMNAYVRIHMYIYSHMCMLAYIDMPQIYNRVWLCNCEDWTMKFNTYRASSSYGTQIPIDTSVSETEFLLQGEVGPCF